MLENTCDEDNGLNSRCGEESLFTDNKYDSHKKSSCESLPTFALSDYLFETMTEKHSVIF